MVKDRAAKRIRGSRKVSPMKAESARWPTIAESGPRFRHILVPTDLTERTEKALALACKLADSDEARVTLIHVMEAIDGLRFDELKSFYAKLERNARSKMAALARLVPKGTLHTENAVVYGRRAEEIVSFAAANSVDLIVLASHRVNPSMSGRDWGTISYKVGILAQCPVLLVK
jgi:nucleotide-binding universal stress UspA family protein